MYLKRQTDLTILFSRFFKIKWSLFKWTGHVVLKTFTQTAHTNSNWILFSLSGCNQRWRGCSHLKFLIFAWQDTLPLCISLTRAFHLSWQTFIQVRLSTQWIFNDSPGNYRERKKKKSKQNLGNRFATERELKCESHIYLLPLKGSCRPEVWHPWHPEKFSSIIYSQTDVQCN